MDEPITATTYMTVPLERSISAQSGGSIRSHRSTTRTRKKLTSQPSSSASSIAPSDKSLTSFPSFSPESPREGRCCFVGHEIDSAITSSRKTSGQSLSTASEQGDCVGDSLQPGSIVENLTTTPPNIVERSALFEDAPLATRKIPGALHHADDQHIQRLIARHGAVNLVRQIAEDLAQRDAQIAILRRKADERERALRKIALECGLSNLDLETRLRAIEQEARANGTTRKTSAEEMLDLMSDAMTADVRHGKSFSDATIKAGTVSRLDAEAETVRGATRGWKDYLWGAGGGGAKKGSRPSSRSGENNKISTPPTVKAAPTAERRPTLPEDMFNPPETNSVRTSSRASSVNSKHSPRKPSLASLALRLVAGGNATRDGEARGRASSSAQAGGSLRTASNSSTKTTGSVRAVSAQVGPKSLMAMRRTTGGSTRPMDIPARAQPQERWDTMEESPDKVSMLRHQSYGPVEMDTILPPEAQPPTLTHIYNNYVGSEFLTDRFGFIYDQRRKKRQREAAKMARHVKKGSRTEMLSIGRGSLSSVTLEDSVSINSDGRPGSPNSSEELREDAKPKRWQDYLKIATFPTELLSHTPLITAQAFEVMEGGEVPKSPGHSPSIMSEERGFVPSTAPVPPTLASVDVENESSTPAPEAEPASTATSAKEDAEPVRLLLENLNQLHDTLQREKTVRWNEFLRKVRAERKRDGEAAAAAAAAAAESRFQRATAVMPETRLGDGELIGVASLGIQGKVGRAKAVEFRSLLLGGIPVAYRSKIWSECSGAKVHRIPGYYEDLVNRPEDQDDQQVVAQIKADITRTLTDNIFFRKGPGVGKLHEVLLAYSRRNPEVGYCQGMNLVVANLLLITPSAEDAFWLLVALVEHILPRGYFDHSLLASRADQQVLRQFVSEVLPKLSAHFEDLSIDLETMTFQWFLSVFTDCLSAEALFRVWDIILCTPHDGGAFLFQVALALLKLNESQLLACSSPASVYTYINHQMTNHAISIDGLIQASEALRRLVRKEDIEQRREKAIESEREVVRAREERLMEYQAKRKREIEERERKERESQKQEAGGGSGSGSSNKDTVKGGGMLGVMKSVVAPAVVSEEVASGATTPSLGCSLSRSVSLAPSPLLGPVVVGGGGGESDVMGGESGGGLTV